MKLRPSIQDGVKAVKMQDVCTSAFHTVAARRSDLAQLCMPRAACSSGSSSQAFVGGVINDEDATPPRNVGGGLQSLHGLGRHGSLASEATLWRRILELADSPRRIDVSHRQSFWERNWDCVLLVGGWRSRKMHRSGCASQRAELVRNLLVDVGQVSLWTTSRLHRFYALKQEFLFLGNVCLECRRRLMDANFVLGVEGLVSRKGLFRPAMLSDAGALPAESKLGPSSPKLDALNLAKPPSPSTSRSKPRVSQTNQAIENTTATKAL